MPRPRPRRNRGNAKRRRPLFVTLLALAGLTLAAAALFELTRPAARAASTFTVNSLGDDPDNNLADNLCNAGGGDCTLRAAIQQANATAGADAIDIAVMGTINLTGALPDITTQMSINGLGPLRLTVRRDTGGKYRIFNILNTTVSISGLRVSNGQAADGAPLPATNGEGGQGGGIYHDGGSLTLTDVAITGNNAGVGGTTTTIASNGGFGGRGGGIFSTGLLTMTDVVVSNNRSGDGGAGQSSSKGGNGGGIAYHGPALTMADCTVRGNATGNGTPGAGGSPGGSGDGAGIHAATGTVRLFRVTISNNTAGEGNPGGYGGGLFTFTQATTTMVDSVVSNNKAGKGVGPSGTQGGSGGGIANLGPLHVYNSLISGNATLGPTNPDSSLDSDHGGGVYSDNVTSLTNCTVSGNTADPASASRGGGIFNYGISFTLTNSTVTGNNAVACSFCFQSGQGVHNSGRMVVRNSIIAGNGVGDRPDVTGAFVTHGHNLVGRATSGSGSGHGGDQNGFINGDNGDIVGTLASPIDPKLGPLADNGGLTFTHALLAGSPALDAGNNSVAIDANNNTIRTDQRGAGRFGGASLITDIGAFEFHPTLEAIPPQTTREESTILITFSLGDSGANVTSAAAVSDNQTVAPDAGIYVAGDGPVRLLQINPALNGSGTANITVTVNYSGGAVATHTFQLTVTPVNDAPSFTKGADQTVAEDTGLRTVAGWATAVSPGPNESGQSVTFVVSDNTNPSLFSTAPAVSPAGALTFTTAPNAHGEATITLAVKDDGGTADGGQDTSATQTFKITVTSVNDPPVALDQSVTTPEDFSRLIVFGAADFENDALTFSVVSGPSNGTLTGTGSSRTYVPAADFNGTDSFTFKATDSAGDVSQVATVTITVTAINDAPVNVVPGPQATDQNSPLVFSAADSNAVTVADVDAGADPLRVTLTAVGGTLTLGATAGLTFAAGDGSDDATMTFSGAVADLNAALNGLTFKPNAGFSGAASLQVTASDQGFNGAGGARTDTDFVSIAVRPGTIEFTQAAYTVGEGAGSLAVTVRRTGDTSTAASVDYATDDGSVPSVSVPCSSKTGIALDRCDFTKALGRLVFAPGEAEKTVSILISDDSYVEGPETALIRLSAPAGGPLPGSRTAATLEVADDEQQEGSANPVDDTTKFVRQHYHDFLNREPDASGLAFWANEIESCGDDAQCREVKRIHVSAAFFLSIEFQQTGYLVYRLDKVALGNLTGKPVPLTLSDFMADTQSIGRGLVVGADGWERQLEENKRAFVDAFVTRTGFTSRYPAAMTPEQYVAALNVNAGGVLSQGERDSLAADLRGGAKTRAQVLRAVAEHPSVVRRESNQAFVLMQFFGYLRRDPDSAPDSGFAGHSFWLGKLDEFDGDFIRAEMVKAFLDSIEYRRRFGQ